MNCNMDLTARRMGYGLENTYSAIGLMVEGERQEFALVQLSRNGEQQVIVHHDCDPKTPSQGGSTTSNYPSFYQAMKGYNEAFAEYLVGKRVRLTEVRDVYPTGVFQPGLTGTITSIEGYIIAVKLDEYRDELSEWDNELHWNSEGHADDLGRDCITIEDFLHDVEFIDGDIKEVA